MATSSEPPLDLDALRKLVSEQTTDLPLQLTKWEKEYKERMGLSFESTNDTTSMIDTVLPLHPQPLSLEVQRYHTRIKELKTQYIHLAAKHQFYLAILQDPPRQVQPGQAKEVEKAIINQYSDLTIAISEMNKLKASISSGNASNEKDRQELYELADTMTQMIDDIEAQKRTLASLVAESEQYANVRTPAEAKQLLEEQTRVLVDIIKAHDAKMDELTELEMEVEEQTQELGGLESTCRRMEAKAKDAVKKHAQRDIKMEQQAIWYKEMTQFCQSMFGLDEVKVDIDTVQVTFATGDVLTIHVDPVTDRITTVELDNDSVDISDLEYMARGQHMKEIGSTVALETLARTRDL